MEHLEEGWGQLRVSMLACLPAVESAPARNLLHWAHALPLPISIIMGKIILLLCKVDQ